MNMFFERKLAIPMEVKEMYPLTGDMSQRVEKRIAELKGIDAETVAMQTTQNTVETFHLRLSQDVTDS